MDTNKANCVKNVTKAEIDCAQGMNDNVEIGPINKEQKNIIEKLEEVLNFFKTAQIENEDALVFIKKPLDDLQSSLKFIPIGPHFNTFPYEIKTDIMSYLCDSNAFTAASVCQEWKEILKTRFTDETVISIGEPCCNNYQEGCYKCSKDMKCFSPEVMLRASADHKLDVLLEIHRPVKEVEPKLVTEGLTSASGFSLCGIDCKCDNDESFESDSECEINPLSFDQIEDLFKCLENKNDIMEKVRVMSLDLTKFDQDRLVYCLTNKIKHLELSESEHHTMLNAEKFIRKLSEQSTEFKLNHLTLKGKLNYPVELALELANALCNVEHVKLKLGYYKTFPLEANTVKQLFQNILTRSVKIKTLILWKSFDFRKLINPEDLKKFLNKMLKLRLHGTFTPEQIKAAQSLPDIRVNVRPGSYTVIAKGRY